MSTEHKLNADQFMSKFLGLEVYRENLDTASLWMKVTSSRNAFLDQPRSSKQVRAIAYSTCFNIQKNTFSICTSRRFNLDIQPVCAGVWYRKNCLNM